MNIDRNGHGSPWNWRTIWRLLVAGGNSFGQHWLLATFSLVAAFALWFVIQDVENPRVAGYIPAESDAPAIVVEPLNVPGGYVVAQPSPVRVRVEARKEDLGNLVPSDFTATIDLKDEPVGQTVFVRVNVTSKRNGVRVTDVTPSSVAVTIVQAAVKSMTVNVHRLGQLSPNYLESGSPVVEPAKVEVSGLPNLVGSVDTVDLDVDMSTVTSSNPIEGNLVARTATGTTVTVSLSAARAKVSFSIAQQFEQRTLGPKPNITGQPASGYHITDVLVDPPTVTISGLPKDIDTIQDLALERLDITGATTNVNAIRKVVLQPNISVDHQTVSITVEVKPIECGLDDAAGGPCSAATFVVSPQISAAPTGLALAPVPQLTVPIQVYGPLDKLSALRLADVKATISLAGGKQGIGTFPVSVSVPAGLTAAPPDPLTLTLVVTP